ncbi:hypothetical protein PUN28_006282 [Cardiocondyla obscurior]|uniref:Uncharacterized protein n=1 Tax=Cardiocondyla obscurior TaxID=286306 RepID=A0AAW2GE35_9HYME
MQIILLHLIERNVGLILFIAFVHLSHVRFPKGSTCSRQELTWLTSMQRRKNERERPLSMLSMRYVILANVRWTVFRGNKPSRAKNTLDLEYSRDGFFKLNENYVSLRRNDLAHISAIEGESLSGISEMRTHVVHIYLYIYIYIYIYITIRRVFIRLVSQKTRRRDRLEEATYNLQALRVPNSSNIRNPYPPR